MKYIHSQELLEIPEGGTSRLLFSFSPRIDIDVPRMLAPNHRTRTSNFEMGCEQEYLRTQLELGLLTGLRVQSRSPSSRELSLSRVPEVRNTIPPALEPGAGPQKTWDTII